MPHNFPIDALKSWFLAHKRDLPWRKSLSPYAVWVSEIMLQQTQVQTVIPYFEKWMKTFPTLEDLAKAPLEDVIKLWEGLGYYSRARNLHKGAKQIVENFNKILPCNESDLIKICGIGPYTRGAILSFAFKKKATLIDGNVKRVFSRFLGLQLDFSKFNNHKKLDQILHSILPDDEPWIFNEALMELGALICTPLSPNCTSCPLNQSCYANLKNMQSELPLKKDRKKIVKLFRLVLIFEFNKKIMVKKQKGNLMQDLYEFPYFELSSMQKKNQLSHEKLIKYKEFSSDVLQLPIIKHSFTHHQVTLFPYYLKLSKKIYLNGFDWHELGSLGQKPFSAGHRKIINHFKEISF